MGMRRLGADERWSRMEASAPAMAQVEVVMSVALHGNRS